MSDDPTAAIVLAQVREAAARTRLTGTLHQLQARLKPRALARAAVIGVAGGMSRRIARDTARQVAESAAKKSADVVRRNPGPLAGMVAAAGLFLARHRIAALFRRGDDGHATRAVPARSRKHASSEDQP